MEQKASNPPQAKTQNDIEKEAQWRKLIDEQQRSGLSQKAFAVQHGIGLKSLRRWIERLTPNTTKTTLKQAPVTTASRKLTSSSTPPLIKKATATALQTDAERKIYWSKIIKAFENSGLTRNAFARSHGVSTTSLSEWQTRLAPTPKPIVVDTEQSQAVTPLITTVIQSDKKSPSVPVAAGAIELKHTSGFSVVLNAEVNEASLKKVLNCLVALNQKP